MGGVGTFKRRLLPLPNELVLQLRPEGLTFLDTKGLQLPVELLELEREACGELRVRGGSMLGHLF
jgi:hypothetical protein